MILFSLWLLVAFSSSNALKILPVSSYPFTWKVIMVLNPIFNFKIGAGWMAQPVESWIRALFRSNWIFLTVFKLNQQVIPPVGPANRVDWLGQDCFFKISLGPT